MKIPSKPGEAEKGERLYKCHLRSCHHEDGGRYQGRGGAPRSRCSINFLSRQVGKLARGERIRGPNAPEMRLLEFFERAEPRDISAFRSIADD